MERNQPSAVGTPTRVWKLTASRTVLIEYVNMLGATVIFVLDEQWRQIEEDGGTTGDDRICKGVHYQDNGATCGGQQPGKQKMIYLYRYRSFTYLYQLQFARKIKSTIPCGQIVQLAC